MAYLTIQEAAIKWHVSARRMQQLCKEGKIEGAIREGRSWRVPQDAIVPVQELHPPTNTAGRLPLPIGVSSYIDAVTSYYYVDKTLLIRDFIDTLPKVSLFTRPRRFGKTLNMDMLRTFFEKTTVSNARYFKDKQIWRCGAKYQSWQGQFPVIYLSFKDVKYRNWPDAMKDLTSILQAEYARHAELEDSDQCTTVEKAYYHKLIDGTADAVEMARSLAVLSAMLHKHHGKEAIIIIDEYDTPIQQGYSQGYYNEVIGFIRNLFSGAFKDNPHLAYGFLTGILRVAKESIFSGMNNLKVHSIMDDRFSEYFGFTKEEVTDMLTVYGQADKLDEVCEWYDGYRFGKTSIFNPWSVINYIDENCFPKAYWQSTGSNEIIGLIQQDAPAEVTQNLRRLLQGETVTTYVDTDVIYPEIRKRPSSIYSFLLVTGYLKNAAIVPQHDGNFMCEVSIPNKEISLVYEHEIIARLPGDGMESTATEIQQAVYQKDTARLQASIQRYLLTAVSVFDTGSEAFYQGLMMGLCAILNNHYTVKSNRESGLGRFDIQLCPISSGLPGFILELKASKDASEDLQKLAETALSQIEEKVYDTEMQGAGIREILHLGIAFRGKEVTILSR